MEAIRIKELKNRMYTDPEDVDAAIEIMKVGLNE